MDRERFDRIRNSIVGAQRERCGIGTLQEKTVHAILKDYYAPDKGMQEITVSGYVADIYTGTEIIEIQTAGFNRIRDKLDVFLRAYPVTIVYPIPYVKYLCWIDEETGEISKPRKSPVKGSVYMAFYELYKIKPYLKEANLHLCFPYLELTEYRFLNGWGRDKKKGSHRYDRIPLALVDEVRFDGAEDYAGLIPKTLPEPFTAKELGTAVKERRESAARALHIMNYLEVVEQCGKKGRAYAYRVRR